MSNIAALPTTGHANCKEDVASFLREMADNVEKGEHGEIRQMLVILEAGGDVDTWISGGPCDNARILGLMHMAAWKFAKS